MLALAASIHILDPVFAVLGPRLRRTKTWMVGTSPTMTESVGSHVKVHGHGVALPR